MAQGTGTIGYTSEPESWSDQEPDFTPNIPLPLVELNKLLDESLPF